MDLLLSSTRRPLVATLCILGVCLLCLPSCRFVLWNLQMLREWMVSREESRRIALRREGWWRVNVSGGITFDLVPSLDPAASDEQGRVSITHSCLKEFLVFIIFSNLLQSLIENSLGLALFAPNVVFLKCLKTVVRKINLHCKKIQIKLTVKMALRKKEVQQRSLRQYLHFVPFRY